MPSNKHQHSGNESPMKQISTGNREGFYLSHLPPGQNGRHFADDIFRCISVNEIFYVSIKISLMFVLKGPIDNKPNLV